MQTEIFDYSQRALRRDRAARMGPALFLHDRTFDDICDRLQPVRRTWNSALLIGCPNPDWPTRLKGLANEIAVVDPGALFAGAVGGLQMSEDIERLGASDFDLCVAIGTLDTVNDVLLAARNVWAALRPDSMLIGAISGGATLPKLRQAMRAADAAVGEARPRVHPRIDGPGLCAILTEAGFRDPVVDIDRVSVRYRSLSAEVADLRAMAGTNILKMRSRAPLLRRAREAAQETVEGAREDGGFIETFEILHFAAWTPPEAP